MKKLTIFILIIFLPLLSFALDYKEYILLHNSNLCSNYFDHLEQKHNIPQHLLRSISVIETGRWHHQVKFYFPWPWAVNQGGKAYYFATKNEAIVGVKKMLEKGLTNIDIGCMQINIHHHPAALLNLNQAFEPKDNIEYAASFLKSHYKQSNNWKKAVASYHSQAEVGQEYAKKVYKIWSDYASSKLHYNYCTSNTGKLISCDSIDVNTTLGTPDLKEKLVLYPQNVTNHIKVSSVNPRKDLKRLKSVMIPYSLNNEIN
jgi:hypothetical protein